MGILSSYRFKQLLQERLSENLASALRLLCEASSVLYNIGFQKAYAGRTAQDLARIQSYAGCRVLGLLEAVLSKNSLSKMTLGNLKAIFLVLFGTILAVGYTRQIATYGEVGVLLMVFLPG